MSTSDMLRRIPDDGVWRPAEHFGLSAQQLAKLLHTGLIEERQLSGRPFYRRVQKA